LVKPEVIMNHDTNLKVSKLLKISLSIEAGTLPAVMDLTNSPRNLEFIFGIGSGGITPFEYELVEKQPGDAVTLHVQPGSAPVFFEHLTSPIMRGIESRDPFYMKAKIVSITQPDNREIIKAMAEKSDCGEGCDCGCGC